MVEVQIFFCKFCLLIYISQQFTLHSKKEELKHKHGQSSTTREI